MDFDTRQEARQNLKTAIDDFVKTANPQVRQISDACLNLTFWESQTPLKMRKVQMWLGMALMALREISKSLEGQEEA